ncbi:phosphatidylinositol 4,5-bisphosphate 5-phosphatase A isoform X2 [Narcine bancroftii]|uniref:phosphatidylinositol 4,5-bisphosphate 5-phosphatase A isoform X2 n=1 Tax=Narcine bancroftii TaxID=1343680 RepID=UPI003830FEFD
MSGAVVQEQPGLSFSPPSVPEAVHAGDDGFSMQIITWNVGTAVPPDDVTSLLGLNSIDGRIDMYVIGLQEVNSMINKRLKDAIFTDQWSEIFMDTLSPFGYVLVTSERMQGQLLLLFAKYYLLPNLQDIQTNCTRTGLGGYWGNKGAVSVRLALCGHMICFLNCHLPAHMENSEQRMDDFESILQLQQFNGPIASGVLDHDVVFWFGDLNFRIEQYDIRFVKNAIEKNKLGVLWEKDQLNIAKVIEPSLNGFQEGPLNFRPTYKYDVGTNTFDTSSKKRKPAWTDRILWRVKMSGSYDLLQNSTSLASSNSSASKHRPIEVFQRAYRSHMEYLISDHKPVSAIFCLKFSQKLQTPLIQLQVEDEWNQPSDAVVRYRMAGSYAKSTWDWLGLYRVGFKHHKDYITYVWAKHDEADSDKQCYQIILPSSSSNSSKSDSSDSSSDGEEMSTLKLIRPKSRSPSPGKMKKSRSRSRSKSPVIPIARSLQGLNFRVGPKHKSKSRSPSPRGSQLSKDKHLKEPEVRVIMGNVLSPEGPLNDVSSPSAIAAIRHSETHGKDQTVTDPATRCIGRPGNQVLQAHDGDNAQHPCSSPKLFQSTSQDEAVGVKLDEVRQFSSSKNHPSRSPSTSARARGGQTTGMTSERSIVVKTATLASEEGSTNLELKPVQQPSPKTTLK